MDNKIYGVDLAGEITLLKVRDAIIECFIQAHAEVLNSMKEYHKFNSAEEFEEMKQMNVTAIIKSIFKEIEADFDNPTKEDLAKVCDKLVDYAVNFRSPELVKKHFDEIMLLFNKLN
jgi:hypothetical protein